MAEDNRAPEPRREQTNGTPGNSTPEPDSDAGTLTAQDFPDPERGSSGRGDAADSDAVDPAAQHAADDDRHEDAHEEPGEPESGRRRGKRRKGSFWREMPIMIVTALVVSLVLQAYVARLFVIPSQSMEATLHGCPGCENDRVVADEVSYYFTDPAPGDVVIFRGPESWGHGEFQSDEDTTNPVSKFFNSIVSFMRFGTTDEKDFVKRVIATEGQTVSCCGKNNEVLVDGKPLHEPYIHWQPGKPHQQDEFSEVTVPPGHIWVMGDNRNNSLDSRFQGGGGVNGAVPVDHVIGKARFIVLPPGRWGSIDSPNPQITTSGPG